MSSTPQTSGFQVSVMPQVQLADPRLFNAYGSLANGLGQGVQLADQISSIALRRQQEQRLQDQFAYEQSLRPLQTQLANVNLQGAIQKQKLADVQFPGKVTAAKQPIQQIEGTFQDLDEDGNLVEYANVKEINPQTGEENIYQGRPMKTIKTAAQLEQDRLNAEATRQWHTSVGAAAMQRAATAEQVAAWKAANPTSKVTTFYDEGDNVFQRATSPTGETVWEKQIFTPDGRPAKRPKNTTSINIGGVPVGASTPAPVPAPAPVAPARQLAQPMFTVPGMHANVAPVTNEDAYQGLADSLTSAINTPESPAAPAGMAFASEAEAAIAASKGLIGKGSKITIAGVPGTWQ